MGKSLFTVGLGYQYQPDPNAYRLEMTEVTK
jgi:hypothetical protein